ncbi:unnamed protein product [Closterium sp. Naga37s-1]|nr:unnamed protein product [Closterium sp. Naga37s-1]
MNKATILELAKGFRGRAKNCIRAAKPRVEKALTYAYRDRRTKKRDMRGLAIERVNAGARQYGFCCTSLALTTPAPSFSPSRSPSLASPLPSSPLTLFPPPSSFSPSNHPHLPNTPVHPSSLQAGAVQ